MKSMAIISPHFPPMNSGVGDYTWTMSQEWSKLVDELFIITAQPKSFDISISNIHIINSLSISDFHKNLFSNIIKLPKETMILFQFTPNMYSRIGINWKLLLTLLRLKIAGRSFSIFFHEKFYPFNLKWPDFFLGTIQPLFHIAFKLLSSKNMYSFNENHTKKFPYPVIPVCSNMPIVKEPDSSIRAKYKLNDFLIYFGSTHPSKCVDWVIESYDRLDSKTKERFPLVIVGSSKDELPCQVLLQQKNIRVLGYLSGFEVSQLLYQSTLVLAPFIDGVSSRRGSVLAALSNSAIVVTNCGRNTNQELAWADFCLISPTTNKQDYYELVKDSVTHIDCYQHLKSIAKQSYLANFDARVNAKKIYDILFMPG